jgi:RNA polymerase sigma-B factor
LVVPVQRLAYAVPTISGEVKRYFRDQGWAVRPPRRLQELGLAIGRVRGELEHRLGRSPTVPELARELGADEDDVIEAVASGQNYRAVSLDTPVTPDGESAASLAEGLPSQDDEIDKVEERLSLRPLLDKLPARERRILALWYFEELTQQQIGERVGVTQMQVSRLINRTLHRLRKNMLDASQP